MNLELRTRSYLEAERYRVDQRDRGLLVGARASVGGGEESIYVWVNEQAPPDEVRARERSLLTAFGEANEVEPAAAKFLLLPTYQGLSSDFRRDAKKWFNVTVTVPAFFFDTDFSWDSGSKSPTAARALKERGDQTRRRRIPQPFLDSNDIPQGGDLLRTLVDQLSDSKGPSVHIVAGPAGAGKSVLFETLYAEMYSRFHDDKSHQILSPRPLPLLPDYLASSDAPTVRALVRAFMETDFVRALDVDVFHWMMIHGSAMWLLDGLDEVIAQDPDFFEFILELLTDPDASVSPRIVICVRDSLLSSNDDLRELCESYADTVQTHRLAPWEDESKKRFARLTLGDDATAFVETLRSRPELDRLASTPYYCALLAELQTEGELRASYTEADLLRHALSSIIEREFAKGLLDRALTDEDAVVEFLETLALVDLEGGLSGVRVSATREFAEAMLPADLPEADLERFVSQFSQLALFSSAGQGRLRFAQEILEQFLIGLALIDAFDQRREVLRHRLSYREIPREWVTFRVVADHIRQHRFADLTPILYDSLNRRTAFRNALQIAVYAKPDPAALCLPEFSFDRQDLSGLEFIDCDFKGMSFRGADFTNAIFRRCTLHSAQLEDVILRGTVFDIETGSMAGANIGDLGRFYSMRVGSSAKPIDDASSARSWFEDMTGIHPRIVEPCDAAQQLRHLFGKFVRPTGAYRRSWLDRKGVISGKRYRDPEAALTSAVRLGYLIDRGRIARPEGDLYAEMVGYMTDLRVSPGLRALLTDICDVDSCVHVPPAR